MDKVINKLMKESKSNSNDSFTNDVREELIFKLSSDDVDSDGNLPLTIINVHKGKKAREIHAAGLTCCFLWDGGASHSIINYSYVKKFKSKFRSNETICLRHRGWRI